MLQNKLIVISGATTSIGKQTALELAKYKTKIVLVASKKDNLTDTVNEIRSRGSQAEAVRLNTITEGTIKELVTAIKNRYGQIDMIVNGSGEFVLGDFENAPVEIYKHIIVPHTEARWPAVKSIVAGVRARGQGAIINVATLIQSTRVGVKSLIQETFEDEYALSS